MAIFGPKTDNFRLNRKRVGGAKISGPSRLSRHRLPPYRLLNSQPYPENIEKTINFDLIGVYYRT